MMKEGEYFKKKKSGETEKRDRKKVKQVLTMMEDCVIITSVAPLQDEFFSERK